MEKRTNKIIQLSLRAINVSLSNSIPNRACSKKNPTLAKLKNQRFDLKKYRKQKEPTYSIAYIGDKSGELKISLKRFSIPMLTPKQISKSHHTYSPQSRINTGCEYTINKYFRPKALTPTPFKLTETRGRMNREESKIHRNNDEFVRKSINAYSLLDFRYK